MHGYSCNSQYGNHGHWSDDCFGRRVNPTKLHGTEKLLPRLSQILDGWRKVNPPLTKKLLVESDIPEYLCNVGQVPTAMPLDEAIGELMLIAF
jgi:hypothetical protein